MPPLQPSKRLFRYLAVGAGLLLLMRAGFLVRKPADDPVQAMAGTGIRPGELAAFAAAAGTAVRALDARTVWGFDERQAQAASEAIQAVSRIKLGRVAGDGGPDEKAMPARARVNTNQTNEKEAL